MCLSLPGFSPADQDLGVLWCWMARAELVRERHLMATEEQSPSSPGHGFLPDPSACSSLVFPLLCWHKGWGLVRYPSRRSFLAEMVNCFWWSRLGLERAFSVLWPRADCKQLHPLQKYRVLQIAVFVNAYMSIIIVVIPQVIPLIFPFINVSIIQRISFIDYTIVFWRPGRVVKSAGLKTDPLKLSNIMYWWVTDLYWKQNSFHIHVEYANFWDLKLIPHFVPFFRYFLSYF